MARSSIALFIFILDIQTDPMPIVSKYVKLNTSIPLETLADFIANGVHFALAYLLLFMKYYVVNL